MDTRFNGTVTTLRIDVVLAVAARTLDRLEEVRSSGTVQCATGSRAVR
jgi:hypothetical protein